MFNNIIENEYDKLKDAIALITVLVAGADGKIDKDEKEWATKLTDIRSYSNAEELQPYYEDVGMDFEPKLSAFIDSLPSDTNERTKVITAKLALLNPIMAKLENQIGASLYKSYVSFAEHVAKASGGFFRFGTVSKEESNVMNLNMIDPIHYEEPQEEEIEEFKE